MEMPLRTGLIASIVPRQYCLFTLAMPAAEQITDSLIRDNIARAVGDVFRTMLGRDPILTPVASGNLDQIWPVQSPLAGNPRPHIVGTVGFIGDANGLI